MFCLVDFWGCFFFYFVQNILSWAFCLVGFVWMQVSVYLELLDCVVTLLGPFRNSWAVFPSARPTCVPVMCLLHILANLCFVLLVIVLWEGVRGHLTVGWFAFLWYLVTPYTPHGAACLPVLTGHFCTCFERCPGNLPIWKLDYWSILLLKCKRKTLLFGTVFLD